MKITIVKYKKRSEGKIKGTCDIILNVEGFPFKVRGVKVITSPKGGHFYSFPDREYIDKDTGDKRYIPHCSFEKEDKEAYIAFRSSMNHAFREYFAKEESPIREKPLNPNRALTPPSKVEPLSTDGDFVEIAKHCDEHKVKHDFPF